MAIGIGKYKVRGVGGNREPHNSNLQSEEPENKKSGVASYILMPGIIPQIRELTTGGFGFLALLIASIYRAVRILPANHPYTQYENLGTFGIRHVIAAAANNVKLDKKNIDQIIIFFAVFAGLIILALQFLVFLTILLSGDAWAAGPGPGSFGGIFSTDNPQTDIAFHMLREVFGIPDMFGTLANGGAPSSLHQALHALFNFYNLAILLIAVIVFIYYVIVVVAETAQTGTPFGQRFSHIYAPIRLVVAIGLLVPLNYGLNSSQYITLFVAKIGSGFATTGWTEFNKSLAKSNPLGADNATLIAQPKAPDIEGLVEFMAMVVTCREARALQKDDVGRSGSPQPIEAFVLGSSSVQSIGTRPIHPGPSATPAQLAAHKADLSAYQGQMTNITDDIKGTEDIRVIFGIAAQGRTNYEGNIIPYCGTLVIPINTPVTNANPYGGLQAQYFRQILMLWNDADLRKMGQAFATVHSVSARCGKKCIPPSSDKNDPLIKARIRFDNILLKHFEEARKKTDFSIQEQTIKRGWGGAGIWYNRIAEINGAYVLTALNIPAGQKFPTVMEEVRKEKQKGDGKSKPCEAFQPDLSEDAKIQFGEGELDAYYAETYNDSYQYWTCEKKANTGNFFLDAASALFGLNGLLNIRDTTTDAKGNTVQIHPLAKLSVLGKGLIESAIRNMAMAVGASAFGGMPTIIGQQFAGAAMAASSMFVSIATVGLSIGFLTFYVLPFLPFIYFFFAVGNWVKSIFEAMVGAPLWALSHLRIDGDGLPGRMAMNGYLLILEIFLRPILTVFGLLGGMAIFSALVAMLNEVFDLVVVNTAGVDLQKQEDALVSRHIVDVFFFTCVYAVILYMMAVSSFKMINLVPNNILRWLGQSVAAFSDNAPDPTQGLTQYAALGGARIGGQLAGGLTQGAKGVGGLGDGLAQIIKGPPTK